MCPQVCVAPRLEATSSFHATGSTAMTLLAPACSAPCRANAPMPPIPITMMVSPGFVSAMFTAEPQPVLTAQPTRQADSSGIDGSILTADVTPTVVCAESVEIPHRGPQAAPSSDMGQTGG